MEKYYDLKSLTKEEVAYFIDFAREQNVRRNYRDRIKKRRGK